MVFLYLVTFGLGLGALHLADAALGAAELLAAMIANPILIERPIVVANGRAAIGRPPEDVLNIL